MLPLIKDDNQPFQLMQTKWKSQLDPLLVAPLNGSLVLNEIKLVSGVNVINHKLGRPIQGWMITDISAPATIYRSAAFNKLTLTLTSNAVTVVNIMVF